MAALDRQFNLREVQRDPEAAGRRLWPISRVTAWRIVKHGMLEAGIVGRAACPRGLRHSFAVNALQASVPLNIVQKWLGHAHISTTAIYAAVAGPEEILFAERFWQTVPGDQSTATARPARKRKCGLRRRRRRMPWLGEFKRWSAQAAIALCVILMIAAGLQAVARLVASSQGLDYTWFAAHGVLRVSKSRGAPPVGGASTPAIVRAGQCPGLLSGRPWIA
jgi:hypothetical protein